MTFFRMKLRAADVVALDHGNEFRPIMGARQHVARICANDMIGMNKIKTRISVEALQQWTRPACSERAPADMRNLERTALRHTKSFATGINQAKPDALPFLAAVCKHLHPKAHP